MATMSNLGISFFHLPSLRAQTVVYLGALAAALWLMNRARGSFWLLSLLALPGTFCHELCHWGIGTLLNGHPIHFTVIPQRREGGYVLGSVSFVNLRWYNAFFIGMAPLLMLPLAWLLFLWRLGGRPTLGWPEAAMVFLLANLLFGAAPSWQDLRIAASSPVGWLLLAGGLVWGGWEIRGRLPAHSPAPPTVAVKRRPHEKADRKEPQVRWTLIVARTAAW
jgi:hypothetical protein